MDQEPDLRETPAELSARQDRLERQLAELSHRLSGLEAQLSPMRETRSAQQIAPPPPPPPQLGPELAVPHRGAPFGIPNPSLENRLGSQVFNRIGIFALLIGAAWFLKLAIDSRWIGPTGRILVGLLAGAAIVLWSERFRRSGFLAFSYSLKAIGSGVLYLSLWASFQLFHLLPASGALAAMLAVTAWNAYMAWAQETELLAAYALAGGLATPVLLSTGGNHETFLFTYLLAIDLACVLLARLRPWSRLLAAAFPATVAYFISWYARFYAPSELAVTAVFVILFFAVFAIPVFGRAQSHQAGSGGKQIIDDILLPLANAAFVSLALYSVLQDSGHHDLLAWLMLALSATYLGLMRLPQPPLTSALHLALAVVFLTLAIPLKASGAWITVGWLVEGVALLWVSTRASQTAPAGISQAGRALRILASGSLLLGFGGILFELISQDLHRRSSFFNRGFGTAAAGMVSFALAIVLARSMSASEEDPWPSFRQIAAGSLIAFNLSALLAGVVQISSLDLFGTGPEAALARALSISAFLMLYGALLLAAGFWRRIAFVRWQALLLLVFTIAKTFLYDMRNLSQGYRVLSFLGLGALLMAISFAYQNDWLSLRETAPDSGGQETLS